MVGGEAGSLQRAANAAEVVRPIVGQVFVLEQVAEQHVETSDSMGEHDRVAHGSTSG